ncbi:Indole-3-pyruvate monooxygenase [Bertholletia excelsa]
MDAATTAKNTTEPVAIIVGSGPSGLAAAACLNQLSVPNIVLEREDCFASLWKKKSYDRLHLHVAKKFCELPHMPFPATYPTYVPRKQFLDYLDDYVSRFKISPLYHRLVESASYDEVSRKWIVKARNIGGGSGEVEEYSARYLVVATGETSEEFVPEVEGLEGFTGEILHSTRYKSGKKYRDKRVLVVGSGNSGMEIAVDLSDHGAKTSIVVRSSLHVLSRGMANLGLNLLKYFPYCVVDFLMVLLSKLRFGDLSKYGIQRPEEGPFALKVKCGKYPVVDVGTCKKIKSGEIQVLPAISSIGRGEVIFENGKSHPFDAIVFATGFRRSTHKWLKGDDYLLNEDGIPKPSFPNHWKGENGLYCVGLARRGLHGAALDAQSIANDIKSAL